MWVYILNLLPGTHLNNESYVK